MTWVVLLIANAVRGLHASSCSVVRVVCSCARITLDVGTRVQEMRLMAETVCATARLGRAVELRAQETMSRVVFWIVETELGRGAW